MKDLFSNQSASYASFRPTYPKELYDFILSNTKGRESAWDCATGNGQVARDLASYFKIVEATDISAKQLENATRLANVTYALSSAETTLFKDASFDLITVGQAIHWFDFNRFYSEVQRVARPGATLAVWGYGLLKVNDVIDKIISDFYQNIIGPYWDSERRYLDEAYKLFLSLSKLFLLLCCHSTLNGLCHSFRDILRRGLLFRNI